MRKIYTTTVKYFSLAIEQFLPELKELALHIKVKTKKSEINDLVEMYQDVKSALDALNLNCSDPNRIFSGEEWEVRVDLEDEVLKHLSGLTLRLLDSWRGELVKLESKSYKSEKTLHRIGELQELIRPLEAISKTGGYIIGKFAVDGPAKFPGEDEVDQSEDEQPLLESSVVFPTELMKKLPRDIASLCDEFNFVHKNKKPLAGILLLRRILPLAIVRKFQQLGSESKIQDAQGEYLDTKALLGNVEGLLKNKRTYTEVMNYKLLVDASQHSYSLNIQMSDTEGAAIKIRVFLDHLF